MYSPSYSNYNVPPYRAHAPPQTRTQVYHPCTYLPSRFPNVDPLTSSSPPLSYTGTVSRNYPPPLSHPNDPTSGYFSASYRESTPLYRNEIITPVQDFTPQTSQQCRFTNNVCDVFSESCDEGTIITNARTLCTFCTFC